MNNQEAFDTAYAAIIAQGKPSMIKKYNSCRYRHRGLKCAVGALIPDNLYKKGMEGKTVSSFYSVDGEFPEVASIFKNVSNYLLLDLQLAHDEYAGDTETFIEEFKTRMSVIAKKHNLSSDIIA
jgi:hypothetical protein